MTNLSGCCIGATAIRFMLTESHRGRVSRRGSEGKALDLQSSALLKVLDLSQVLDGCPRSVRVYVVDRRPSDQS